MKRILFLVLLLYTATVFAQKTKVERPEYVIIANKERIITKDQLMEYGQEGLVAAMNKGVSQELRDSLALAFGDKVGEREFVMLVTIKEQNDSDQQESASTPETEEPTDFGLKLNINDNAKDFRVEMTDASVITLSDLKGKVVLLNFWATWCAPCLMEFYDVQNEILTPFKNEDFVFLPISRGESLETVKNKVEDLKKKGIIFESGIDPDKNIWDLYASQSIPKSFVIDKDGVIRYTSIGNFEGSVTELAKEIEKLLKQ